MAYLHTVFVSFDPPPQQCTSYFLLFLCSVRLRDSIDVSALPGHLSVLSIQSKEAEETQVSLHVALCVSGVGVSNVLCVCVYRIH